MPSLRMIAALGLAFFAAGFLFTFVGWQADRAREPREPRDRRDRVIGLARDCVSESSPASAVMDRCFQRTANRFLAENGQSSRVTWVRCVQPDTGQYECLVKTGGPGGVHCYQFDVTYTHLSNHEYPNVNWPPPDVADGCPGVRAK